MDFFLFLFFLFEVCLTRKSGFGTVCDLLFCICLCDSVSFPRTQICTFCGGGSHTRLSHSTLDRELPSQGLVSGTPSPLLNGGQMEVQAGGRAWSTLPLRAQRHHRPGGKSAAGPQSPSSCPRGASSLLPIQGGCDFSFPFTNEEMRPEEAEGKRDRG